MKIVGLENIFVDGGWDEWVFLKITTDEGLVGWGEYSQARARRGLPAIVADMTQLVIGEDPCKVGQLTAKLQLAMGQVPGGLRAMAIGAIENACLDLKAKAQGVPVHDLLGGRMRDRVPMYWSHCGMYRARYPELFETVIGKPALRDREGFAALGREVKERGFSAYKTNPLTLDPALTGPSGPRIQRGTGPIEANVEPWIVDLIVDQMAALKEGAGPGIEAMLDLNFSFKPEGFRRLCNALEPAGLGWLEIDSWVPKQLALIRQWTTIPIASLEAVLGLRDLVPYLEIGAVDVAIIDPVFNGALQSSRMAVLCDASDVNVAGHNAHGPLGDFICANFCAATPNLRVMEYVVDEVPWRRDMLTHPPLIENGSWVLSDRPGWGADLNEEVARAHPPKVRK